MSLVFIDMALVLPALAVLIVLGVRWELRARRSRRADRQQQGDQGQ